MLANGQSPSGIGALGSNVLQPSTFFDELLGFVADQLPQWRDRPERKAETSETILTSQLCAHLNGAARHSAGWDILQFRVEEPDERNRGRKIDLIPSPAGSTVWIEGRRYTDFDALLPIECKRLPTPTGTDRDQREYVFSTHSSTGGIQRFKSGAHGSSHTRGAMIAYVQSESIAFWKEHVCGWIRDLAGSQPGWTTGDVLQLGGEDSAARTAHLHSSHDRSGLPAIALRHLWVVMN